MKTLFTGRGRRLSIMVAAGIAVSMAGIGTLLASDHQDTPEVELNPRMDINDVYAFPGSTSDRVALVLTTSSPLSGTNASFDPDLLRRDPAMSKSRSSGLISLPGPDRVDHSWRGHERWESPFGRETDEPER